MIVIGKVGAVGLAFALVVASASFTMAAPRHAGARVAAHGGHGHGRHDARRHGLGGGAIAGAAANTYYSDSFYGGPAYGFYGAPAYGYYRGYY